MLGGSILLLPAVAQTPRKAAAAGKASISGFVTDQNGAAVAGAKVVLSNDAGVKRETTSDDKGLYSFTALHSGTYIMQVTAPNFPELKLDYINVAAGQEVPLDATMQGVLPKAQPASTPVETAAPSPEQAPSGQPAQAQPVMPAPLSVPAAPLPVLAGSGNISGVATDQTGAVIPGASVVLTEASSGQTRETQTDDKGNYSFASVPPGTYSLAITAPNFATQNLPNIVVSGDRAQSLDVTLQPAKSSEHVNVVANGTGQVEVDTAAVSGTITEKEVVSIGLNGRNFTQLIALAPGVSNQTGQDEAKVGVVGSVKYSVNGGRVEYNTFEVDGSDVLNTGLNGASSTLMVYPSLDAIQEVKVLTSNYGAQFGRTASGTVQVTTKSGGDHLHGNLYEFIRNEAFNTRNYFDSGSKAPLYRRQDFGGTVGGPLTIPKIYDGKKRKTYFFFSEEFRLEKTPTDYNQAVPGLKQRGLILTPQGIQQNLKVSPLNGALYQDFDFSDVCPIGSGTFSRAQFPDCPSLIGLNGGALIPQAHLQANKNAEEILNSGMIPLPNSPSGCNFFLPNLGADLSGLDPSDPNHCYVSSVSPSTYWREELFRIDQDLGNNIKASFRYIHDAWDTTVLTPQWGVTRDTFPTIQNRFVGPGTSLVARVTQTLSPTLINDVVLSYENSAITLVDQNAPGVQFQRNPAIDQPLVTDPSAPGQCNPTLSVDPVTGLPQCAIGHIFNNGFGGKMPGVVFGGTNAAYGGRGFAADPAYMPWGHSNPTFALRDDLTKAFGKHTVQLGGQYVYAQRNQTNNAIGAASGDTQGLLTFSNLAHSTGNAFADFLEESTGNAQGIPAGFIQTFTQDSGQRRYYQRYQIAEPYVQDDWKVTQRLTLNLGLRVSLFGTYREKNQTAWNWDPRSFNPSRFAVDPLYGILLDKTAGSSPVSFNPSTYQLDPSVVSDLGLVQCGAKGTPVGCMKGHLFNPAPRVGFAWDPHGDGKTSIRGGYGIFFEHGTGNESNTGSLEASAPLVLTLTQALPRNYSCIGYVGYGPMFDPTNSACASVLNPSAPVPTANTAFPLNVTAIPTRVTWPYAEQWSFGIQRELATGFVANIAYVGSKGTHLTIERQLNQLMPLPDSENPFGPNEPLTINDCTVPPTLGIGHPGDGTTPFLLQNGTLVTPQNPAYVHLQAACTNPNIPNVNSLPGRPYPGLGQVLSLENSATSSYNALQTTLRRSSGPLTLSVSYTYSHSIDNSSDRSDPVLVDSYNLRGNRASSNFDQRHLATVSYVYNLSNLTKWLQDLMANGIGGDPPTDDEKSAMPETPSRALRMLTSNWQISGVTLAQTGTPFTVINSAGNTGISLTDNAGVSSGYGIAASYPDVARATSRPGDNSQSFGPLLANPSQFVAPRGLTFGNAGRNFLNNPGRLNFDMALQRHFKPTESSELEFRAEMFNVFNHTQYRIYDADNPGSSGNNIISCYAGPAYSAGFQGNGADCVTGASFLHPLNAHRPRTVQFGLKWAF